jgi:hypothetical protein
MTAPRSVFFIKDKDGRIWGDTIRFSEEESRRAFVHAYLPRDWVLARVDVLHVWLIGQANGFRLVELPVTESA